MPLFWGTVVLDSSHPFFQVKADPVDAAQPLSKGLRIETGPGCIGAVELFIMRFLVKNGRSTPVQNRHLTGLFISLTFSRIRITFVYMDTEY